jgi:transposase InsO family protein
MTRIDDICCDLGVLPDAYFCATKLNEKWSMELVSDQLNCGGRFRVLHRLDDFSRVMMSQLVAVSITDKQVARFLDQISEQRQLPVTTELSTPVKQCSFGARKQK